MYYYIVNRLNVYQQRYSGFEYDMNHTFRLFFYYSPDWRKEKEGPHYSIPGDEWGVRREVGTDRRAVRSCLSVISSAAIMSPTSLKPDGPSAFAKAMARAASCRSWIKFRMTDPVPIALPQGDNAFMNHECNTDQRKNHSQWPRNTSLHHAIRQQGKIVVWGSVIFHVAAFLTPAIAEKSESQCHFDFFRKISIKPKNFTFLLINKKIFVTIFKIRYTKIYST